MPELERVNGFPPTAGTTAGVLSDGVLSDGTSFFPLLLEAIAQARHHLHAQFYIWKNDRAGRMVRDALIKAAQRGVQVRVLVDEIGSLFVEQNASAAHPVTLAGYRFRPPRHKIAQAIFRLVAPLL